MITAYLAAEGFEAELAEELRRAGLGPMLRPAHGQLFITDAEPIEAAWSLNTWFDAEELEVGSIGETARSLRARQRNWSSYAPLHRGRAELVTAKLPHVSGRPLALAEPPPVAPLGSWTMLETGRVLAATRCSSPFPNGRPALQERRQGPPSRAYLKLWEALLRIRRRPGPGDVCVDLGASPGGWTWLLSELGASVLAVDKAPLDASVARRPKVSWRGESAFGLRPNSLSDTEPITWVFSDIACYPQRLLALVDQWRALQPAPALLFTVKFQGATDHEVTDQLRAMEGAELFHLFHNKHELTLAIVGPHRASRERAEPVQP